jgi:hypothetical protein
MASRRTTKRAPAKKASAKRAAPKRTTKKRTAPKKSAAKKANVKTGFIELRVAADLLEQIDAEAERLKIQRHGEPVTRSEVVRLLLREAFAMRKM